MILFRAGSEQRLFSRMSGGIGGGSRERAGRQRGDGGRN